LIRFESAENRLPATSPRRETDDCFALKPSPVKSSYRNVEKH
jgi:hypothetical protein